jgi:hypothetical protein
LGDNGNQPQDAHQHAQDADCNGVRYRMIGCHPRGDKAANENKYKVIC